MRNPLTLEAFADWCEKQPPETAYNYSNSKECAVTTYLKSLGLPCLSSAMGYWRDYDRVKHDLNGNFDHSASPLPRTFGALAQRLRAAAEIGAPETVG